MSDTPQPIPDIPTPGDSPVLGDSRSPAGRWQIPLLAVGLLVFSGGLVRMSAAYRPVTYEEEIERVRVLRHSGALTRANVYLLDLLADPKRPPERRGELHRLLAETIRQAEQGLSEHDRHNVRAIVTNLQEAGRYGVALTAEDWVTLGDAYLWSKKPAEAADAYRQALRLSPREPDRLRRRLLEIQLASGKPLGGESLAELDAIIEDSSASPENYLWALDHKVEWLLDQRDGAGALALASAGKERLAGTAEKLALSYTEALCLCDGGARYAEEAETLLRSLLCDWAVRDELWCKANWLLGRLQQLDERPQAALTFYDEVLHTFQAGDVYDACALGRAECLAALERYDTALEAFAALKERLVERPGHPFLDREAIRLTVTAIGESLLRSESPDLGIEHLRFALSLTEGADEHAQGYYLSRIATGLTQMAAAGETAEAASAEDGERRRALLAEAAEMFLSLSRVQANDEVAATVSLQSAVENFDAAGMTERVAEVLAAFAKEHPGSDRRAWALNKLGLTCQGLQRFPEAVAAFDETIAKYPRQLEAAASMVPLAECLMTLGREHVRRGVDLLMTIVDDTAPEPLFDPQAQEYRGALFQLAEHYCRASEQEEPQHLEKAIARLEVALALYPDDPQTTRLHFLLADAYRQSGSKLREEEAGDREAVARLAEEADLRLRRAMAGYETVITELAPHDASTLTELERVYLRASYLYRADCLFDLGRYEDAIIAYNEAVWRYEDLPEAVSASMQIVHCHQRLGQRAEAAAALERLSWLLKKIPATVFQRASGMSSKEYWEGMVTRLQRTGVY